MGFGVQGFLLSRGILASETVRALNSLALRPHRLWLDEHETELARLCNSHSLTSSRFFTGSSARERIAFFDALASDELVAMIRGEIEGDLYFHGTQMFFSPSGDRQPYWHRDIQYMGLTEREQVNMFEEFTHLHVRIPIAEERDFRLVPGSHRRWDTDHERNVRLELAGHSSWEDLPTQLSLNLEPGDVLVFSAHMLHRGTYWGNEDRLSLDLMLSLPHSDNQFLPSVDQLPSAEECKRIRNPVWYEQALALMTGC